MSDWQPISTAMDQDWIRRGDWFMGYEPGHIPMPMRWMHGPHRYFSEYDDNGRHVYRSPTHWMPLPAPPVTD